MSQVRTKGMSATELMQHVAALDKQIQDMHLLLAVIAYYQEDKRITVPIRDLQALPKGSSVQFSYNRKTDQYEIDWVPPPEEKGAGLVLPITADGERAAELVRSSVS